MSTQTPSSPADTASVAPTKDPVGKEGLLAALQDLEIDATTIDHPPLHAVDDAQAWRAANMAEQAGGFCKNLFL